MKIEEFVEFYESGEFEIRFRWIDKWTYAMMDHNEKIVYLNIELWFAEFAMHELVHKKYGLSSEDKDEDLVLKKLKSIKKKTSVKDMKKLANLLMGIHGKSRGK